MKLTQDMIESVYRQIETRNYSSNPQAIIHSDELLSIMSAQMGVSKDTIHQIIQILIDAHKILHIEITSRDDVRGIDTVYGYVISDLNIIRELKNFFEKQLMIGYEQQYRKAKGVSAIIKELFPQIRSLNTTEIGQILNKAVILSEYEKMLSKDFSEFTHEWTERKIAELGTELGFRWTSDIPEINEEFSFASIDNEGVRTADDIIQTDSKRAVDTTEYQDYTDKKNKYPIKRILNIYGIEFFCKIQFRRYEFKYIKQLVDDRQISQKGDLSKIKDMLSQVKRNIYKDNRLQDYRNDILALDKALTHAMFQDH
ncbi:MAG: hypothetical protein ACOC2H_11180 [Spirochaetota bacterium]